MIRRTAPTLVSLLLAAAACSRGAAGAGDPSPRSTQHPAPAEWSAAPGVRGVVAGVPAGPSPEPGPGGSGGWGGEPFPGDVPVRFVEKLEFPLPGGYDLLAPGFALIDLDEDGDLDVFVPMLDERSFLLRNEGDFEFTRVDEEVGLPDDVRASASAIGDCDADGHVDLLVVGTDRLAMLRNLGGHLEEVVGAGLETGFSPGSALFFDAEGDGDLDLFVECYFAEDDCRSGHRLYRNDGSCHFTDVSAGMFPWAVRRAHAVAAFDPDEDGDTDLVVASDLGSSFEPDLVLRNDGTGLFTEVAAELNLRHRAFSMSAEVADIDGDGRLDVYMGNICRNPLALGQGPGLAYVEGDEDLGVSGDWYIDHTQPPLVIPYLDPEDPKNENELAFREEYARNRPDDDRSFCLTSWATPSADLDADGQRELLVVNGAVGNILEGLHEPNVLYWRRPGDARFREVGAQVGFTQRGWGRTGVFADLDGDTRLDLIVGNRARLWPEDAPGFVYRNVTTPSRVGHHLFVELRGSGANRNGIGAVVEVTAGGRTQIAYRTFGTSFLASSQAPLHFGLATASTVDEIVVRWPWGGGVDRFGSIDADRLVTLTQGTGR